MAVNFSDNSLISYFLPLLVTGLAEAGYADVPVVQNYQPTIQGVPTTGVVYFQKIGNKRYGFLGRTDRWNTTDLQMDHTEWQYFETTFQVSALFRQDPYNPTYTASDLVNEAAWIMQSDVTRQYLNTLGIGILRITEVINPFFVDDRDNFEASPSFDFTLVYLNQRDTLNPVVSQFTATTYPI